ncbi:unnamed protein product [Adineta steineri]|uniref:Uncharacterized protein n=1 Tax=Adineta steineri TaxID=433720 RepID=A0A813QJL3_9BILA|nr:unnamed protein product [Adineta steineri]
MSESLRPPIKTSDEKLDRFSFVRAHQTPPQQSRTTTQDQIKNVSSVSAETKSNLIVACSTTYSQTFTGGVAPTTQCTAFRVFTTGLTCSSYSLMQMYGSNDPVGITVTDSSVVTALALALRYNNTFGIMYNGITWKIDLCGSRYEITATGSVCSCTAGYTMRPCHVNSDWGGIAGSTCSPATQTMSLHFE